MTSSPVPYEIRTAVPNDLPRLIDLIADHADFERQKVNRAHLAENLPLYLFGADARLLSASGLSFPCAAKPWGRAWRADAGRV